MFFEEKAVELIGKIAGTLRKQYEPMQIPPEISTWIGYKFTFVVRVLSRKSIHSTNPSFEVVTIKEIFQKGHIIPTISSCANVSTATSLPATTDYKDLPLLIPITSVQPEKQVHVHLHIFIYIPNFHYYN
jgi:replication factor A1